MEGVCYYIISIQSGVCTEGEVRLSGLTASELQGNVEICHDNVWGGVCDDRWWNPDARVVCRQLGFSGTHSNCIVCSCRTEYIWQGCLCVTAVFFGGGCFAF